ncbi:calcium-activated chloride channel regulator 1-like [Bombina bombina]|uniref:calcium-activated chloride channel regulator 1-like n=1 Tax=Bombina bombina TaxID=8345 RepID=UPI00235B0A23|nr:calcium-activated chloride channel regulator 1-like [Bombina bombina]
MGLLKWFAFLFLFHICYAANSSMVTLVNGGYENIVIAINPAVTEDVKIIENIKNMVNEASDYLYKATKQRLYIKNVKILIPANWTTSSSYTKPKTETYDKADVIIASPFLKYGEEPYTLQYGACQEPGKYIHLTPEFILNDRLIRIFGPRGRVLVHEWAHLRWGVFDEYNNEVPFYITGNGNREATRCSLDIVGVEQYKQCNNGGVCTTRACRDDPTTGLYEDGCSFFLDTNQVTTKSIMYSQSLTSVSEFCDASSHNIEAPTLQNRMCNLRSTWEVIMNSTDITSTPPSSSPSVPVAPTFSLLQPKDRVITLVLDVSGSMGGNNRIGRLYQAADVFLIQIVEEKSYVGIVQFHSTATVMSNLVQIVNNDSRKQLKDLLPKTAGGGTTICSGLTAGFQVNNRHDGSTYGTEIILLTDGEDSSVRNCFANIRNSGAVIHTIALGPSATSTLEEISQMTGGLKFLATDNLDANGLIDAFAGIATGSGDISKQAIQLESTVLNLVPNQCLNGTVYVDNTVGNETFFLVTWQSAAPIINLQDPKGNIYTAANFTSDDFAKSARLEIPGTAERGPWHYSLCNKHGSEQAIGITVNSRAADENVPPVTVNAHMNRDMNWFPSPMVVYALVSQGLLPVKGAKVTATVEPVTGSAVTLELLDNGAAADIVKNDGVYSRYFTAFTVNGRYNLKVRAESKQNRSRLAFPRSRALYVPGYIENGVVDMNPQKPIISDDDIALDMGPFSRTMSGGSFEVSAVPAGGPKPGEDLFKPEKITDLRAKIEESTVVLSWTATGDDLDQGNASRYDLRMSTKSSELRDNFNGCVSVNISSLTPQPAGSSETFTFVPKDMVIENGTILYFALIAFDEKPQKSDLSNIAQAALLIPAALETTTESPTTQLSNTNKPIDNSNKINITHLALIVCAAIIIISIIISITVCIVSCKRKKKNPQMNF